jgi:hypothetical protein
MHSMMSGSSGCKRVTEWDRGDNRITVDPQAGCVSHEQDGRCIIFSLGGGPRVQFVTVEGLPPSFINVRQAQEVRVNAREMSPPLWRFSL